MIDLPAKFYRRSAVEVAPDLLGRYLVCQDPDGNLCQARITEVEAYEGPDDKASHASRGPTPRNQVMFGPGGVWYVYLVYGMHNMLNIVTGSEGWPAAVLIRSVAGIEGPGRLTKAWGIDRSFNGQKAVKERGLYVSGVPVDLKRSIRTAPRVGINYAPAVWRDKPYRFFLENLLN